MYIGHGSQTKDISSTLAFPAITKSPPTACKI